MQIKTGIKQWNISLENERKFWLNALLGLFINKPDECQYYQ